MAGAGEQQAQASTLTRWLRYAEATGVRFEVVPRHHGWGALGLPDLRGFAPQRRVVRRFAGEPAHFPRREAVAAGGVEFDDLTVDELWLLHDLAHVIWYDVATLTFGAARWCERDFFVEQHLVSEAFAVLLLDYHVLAKSAHHGLAVDLDAQGWERARRRVKGLPPLDSFALCSELVRHYLAGDSPLFVEPPRAGGADAQLLSRWRDHEASYSQKQRWYVVLWWDALQRQPLSNVRAVVEDPTIAELVWLTLKCFTTDPAPVFTAQVESAARRLQGVGDLFERGAPSSSLPSSPSFSSSPRRPAAERIDFRFTDAAALDHASLAKRLAAATEPAAEELFLLWQLLGTTTPEALTPTERAAVTTLAASVQTTAPDGAAWRAVRSVCERLLAKQRAPARPPWREAFFLP